MAKKFTRKDLWVTSQELFRKPCYLKSEADRVMNDYEKQIKTLSKQVLELQNRVKELEESRG